MSIHRPCTELNLWHSVWKRNRDVTKGIDAVKGEKTCYLPLASSRQEPQEYDAWLKHVTFFPAARRILSGHIGLMFRKRVVLESTPLVQELCKFVTPDGMDLDDFAEHIATETLTTNFTGLLIDHPVSQPGTTIANAIQNGVRPWIAPYIAEHILEIKWGVVRNRKVLVYVRLMDHEHMVRELFLQDDKYVVRIHEAGDNGQFTAQPDVVPLKNGKPLNFIPFVLVTHNHKDRPTTPIMDDVVNLNLQHYRISSRLATAHQFLCFPQQYISGYDKEDDGTKIEVDRGPDVIWYFESPESKPGYLEFEGKGVGVLVDERSHLEQQLSTAGFGMLADEKSGVEAAEALKIRKASENSILAQIARSIARSIRDALNIMADWADGSTVEFAINTSYIPPNIDAQMLKELVAGLVQGTISYDSFFYILRDSGLVDETLTLEEEKQRLADDPPTVEPQQTPTAPPAE